MEPPSISSEMKDYPSFCDDWKNIALITEVWEYLDKEYGKSNVLAS